LGKTVSRRDFDYLPRITLAVPSEDGTAEEEVEYPDYPTIAKLYAEMVVSDDIPACRYVKQACKRYLDMLKVAAKPRSGFYFSDAWSVDVCDFFDKMAVPTGGRKGDKLVAQPWQIMGFCHIFGFRRNNPDYPNEIGARLVREVYWEVPRGSGKSPTAAVLGLYCWLNEDEVGSQIFIGAPKEEQARYVFDPMSVMVKNTPELQEHYGIDVTKKLMTRHNDAAAKVRMISSIADREDGANPHVVIMEELHAQDEGLFNVMDSSLGKRINNLFISITTAGNRAQGVCWNTRKRLINVLAGIADEPSFFGVIYTLDDNEIKDKRIAHDPKRWIKCNPMWGITLSPSSLMERLAKAKTQSEAAVLEFERTRLNIWSNGAGGLISDENWAACEVKGLDILDFRGETAFIGADLGSKNDLSSIGIIFERDGKLAIFNEHFVPSKSKSFLHEEMGPLYTGWVKTGHLTMTNGPITDYNVIEDRIRLWCSLFDVRYIGFDSYQSNQILSSLYNDGIPCGQVAAGVKTVSDPTKDLLARIEGALLEHDGNPVTRWMAMNVCGYFDKRGNVLAQKDDQHSIYKIDGFAALINANVARMDAMLDAPKKWKSVYEIRGGLAGEENE
jgi:phage terminase large subunit-like protein